MATVSSPLPWQGEQWARVGQQFRAGQLPHALLLAGPRDTGKARFATAFARLLLCREPVAGLNCGACHACELSGSGGHGDFRWLEPEGKSRVIKVDQVRAALEFASRTAGFGQRKVMVLAPADALNVNAANALLKCLEEPAAGTHILLLCHRPHSIPATLRSRCQALRFPLPSREEGLAWLRQQGATDTDAEQMLVLAEGAPLRAAELLQAEAARGLIALHRGLEALHDGRSMAADMAAVAAQLPLDEALEQMRVYLQRWLRGQSRDQLPGPRGRHAFQLLDEIQRIQGAVAAGANPNPQLLLDSLLCQFQREMVGDTIGR